MNLIAKCYQKNKQHNFFDNNVKKKSFLSTKS